MERVVLALRDLITSKVATNELLTDDALSGTTTLKVANTSNFRIDDEIFLVSNVSGTTLVENSRLKIDSIPDDKTLILNTATSHDFLLAENAGIQKAINYQLLKCIYIGDLPSIPEFPCITISPISEDNEWLTLRGTTHDYKFQIRVYVQSDNHETTNLYLPKIARYVREILIDNIHPLIDAVSHPLTADCPGGATVVSIADTSSFVPGLTFIRDNYPRPSSQETEIATILSGTNMELRSIAQNDYLVSRGAEIFKINRILYDTRPNSIRMGFTVGEGGTMLKVAEIEYFGKEYICRDESLIP